MKKFKKFVSLLAAVAIAAIMPGVSTLTASAVEPTTYYIRYLEDQNVWRFQTGEAWDETEFPRDLYYMEKELIDGDLIVIDGPDRDLTLNLPVKLNNLTILHTGTVLITTKGIENCYVLKDSVASITGDITNAYVYENARCNLNSNVKNLTVHSDSNVVATVTVLGTVGNAKITEGSKTLYDFSNFPAKTYVMEDGFVRFPVEQYLTSATNAQPAATTTPAAPAPTKAPASSDAYDDVPKTGESTLILWLAGASLLCLSGSYLLNRKHS